MLERRPPHGFHGVEAIPLASTPRNQIKTGSAPMRERFSRRRAVGNYE